MRLMAAVTLVTMCGCEGLPESGSRVSPLRPPAAVEDGISLYFSPHGGAMAAVIDQINQARQSVDVQAYLITAPEFVDALKAACRRGLRVRVILDKNGFGGAYSAVAYFSDGVIPLWRDGRHKEMHDKVVLIDGHIIITGSFNFTDQADELNAENILIMRDKAALFAAYLANFEEHLSHSERR
jgi:phosphatidylserine/phosphatidylglycerophosphate/cardiolipin synthase-like enzyme